jgi:hypothetical protein
MLICQGEGPELDTLQPRYPMREWLFSHPAPPGAIFLAEMIAPIPANPVYLAAPLLPALLYGGIYGWPFGVAAAALVGIPIVVALACVGKAIQIWILLRFSPRTRGVALGVMGWFGVISILPIFLVISSLPTVVALGRLPDALEHAPLASRADARWADIREQLRLLAGGCVVLVARGAPYPGRAGAGAGEHATWDHRTNESPRSVRGSRHRCVSDASLCTARSCCGCDATGRR